MRPDHRASQQHRAISVSVERSARSFAVRRATRVFFPKRSAIRLVSKRLDQRRLHITRIVCNQQVAAASACDGQYGERPATTNGSDSPIPNPWSLHFKLIPFFGSTRFRKQRSSRSRSAGRHHPAARVCGETATAASLRSRRRNARTATSRCVPILCACAALRA